MQDGNGLQGFGYMILALLLLIMLIEYLGVAAPQALVPNFLLDALVPIAFEDGRHIRMAFLIVSVVAATMAGEESHLGAKIGEQPKTKVLMVLVFLFCGFLVYYIDNFPVLLYTFAYPLGAGGYLLSSFIVWSFLKPPSKKMDVKFGIEKTFKEYKTERSIQWYSKEDGVLNVRNIFTHLFILAGVGSGKSFSLIEPIIEHGIKNGWGMLIFDYKMKQNFNENPSKWALTRYAYMMMLKHSTPAKKDVNGNWIGPHAITNDRRGFYVINFVDARYSHRVNPIHTRYLKNSGYANEYAFTLLTNLEPNWLNKREFFENSAIAFFKSIIWYLAQEHPEMCTIAHARAITMMPYIKVLAMLSLNPETAEMKAAMASAEEADAGGQLAGVDASLKTPLDKLNSPVISWILSGDDFSLQLNNPNHPAVLCLGSDPELQETYSPICTLIATVCGKIMNDTGMLKSLYVLDEAPQIKLPKISDLAATCRSNDIGLVMAAQDLAQYDLLLGKEGASALKGTFSNHFYGKVNDPGTAKAVSDMIGTRPKEVLTYNVSKGKGSGGENRTENHNLQNELLVHPHEVHTLETGRFVGMVGDVPVKNGKHEFSPFFNFKPDIKREIIAHEFPHLMTMPDGSELTFQQMEEIVLKNHKQIRKEAYALVDLAARTACLKGLAVEEKVFPRHFYRMPQTGEVRRIVSTLGDIMPGVSGIKVDPETKVVTGTPVFDERIFGYEPGNDQQQGQGPRAA